MLKVHVSTHAHGWDVPREQQGAVDDWDEFQFAPHDESPPATSAEHPIARTVCPRHL